MNKQLTILSTVVCVSLGSQLAAAAPKPIAPMNRGEMLQEGKYPAAYNAPASIAVRDEKGTLPLDTYVKTSFLYWFVSEEGLDIADSGAMVESSSQLSTISVYTSKTDCLFQPEKFQPGFKLAFGFTKDEWSYEFEYTWIRNHTSISQDAPSSDIGGLPVWVNNNWFMQLSATAQAIAATHIKSDWKLAIDLGDFTMARPFYQGRNLTITPFAGIRTAFIRQNLHVAMDVPSESVAQLAEQPTVSRNHSTSWALGPRMGLDAYYLLPKRFRLEGETAISLLYTRYPTVSHRETNASSAGTPTTFQTSFKNYNALRSILEMGLGFGWGTYLKNGKYHLDLAADYDFNLYWNQNMIRSLLDQKINSNGASTADLYLHGLTLTARFDF